MPTPGGFVDVNGISYAGNRDITDFRPETIPGTREIEQADGTVQTVKVNDSWKVSSNATDCFWAHKAVWNYVEDCVDICRGFRLTLQSFFLHIGGVNGITVKGASADVAFTDLTLQVEPGAKPTSHVELGQFDNYWYPGRAPTRRCQFSGPGFFPEQRPVEVWAWDADIASCSFDFQSGHRVTKVPAVVWFPYFLFRYTQLRLVNLWRRANGEEPIATK